MRVGGLFFLCIVGLSFSGALGFSVCVWLAYYWFVCLMVVIVVIGIAVLVVIGCCV